MKKKVILAVSLIIIAVAVFAICIPIILQLQTITGRCLVTTNGKYMIVDKKGSPIVMHNQSGNENLFDGLNSGDKIIITCDMTLTSYPGKTNVVMCLRIAKGNIDDVPEATLSELHRMGYRFEGKP